MATYSCRRPSEVALAALVVCILCLCWVTPTVGSSSGSGRPKLDSGFVKLHFYLQEQVGSSSFVIVPPLAGDDSTSFFGAVSVADQNATATPDPASTVLARTKGIAVVVNRGGSVPTGQEIITTVVLSDASGYGGSTLSVQGFNGQDVAVREMPIVGGTGKFRLARGWVDFSSYFVDAAQGRAILDVTAYVYYGDK